MNIQTEHLENHTARLTVEVDPERLDQAMRRASQKIGKKVRIPGFRPGKAPMDMVLRHYGGYVKEEALEALTNEIYPESLKAAEIEPYAPGSLEKIDEEDGLTLTFVVPKRPEVDLGSYRDIRGPYEVEEVTDAMVDDAMEHVRQDQALLEPADDRPARMGDQVTMAHFEVVALPVEGEEAAGEEAAAEDAPEVSAESEVEADESQDDSGDDMLDEGLDEEDDEGVLIHQHDYDRVLSENSEEDLFPGFSAELVGVSAGDEKIFTLTIPDDYEMDDVAGRTLRIEAHLAKIQSRTVPEWTDALAERVSQGEFKTVLELRVDVRKKLQEQAEEIAKQKVLDQAVAELVEGATIRYPEEVVQEYVDDIMRDLDQNLRQQGLNLQDFLRITGRTQDSLRAEYRERAINRAKRALALAELIRVEELSVDEDDITAEIDRMSTSLGGEQADQFRQFFNSEQSRWNISSRMVTDRALAQLIAIAKGEDPPSGPEANAQAAAKVAEEAVAQQAEPVAEEVTAAQIEPVAVAEETPGDEPEAVAPTDDSDTPVSE